LAITDAPMKNKQMNNNALVKYKNIIRNMFYKEILRDTKSGMDNNPTFFDVLEDLYVRNIIDYKILTPSAVHYMKNGRLGSVFSSFYFRASIMNPYLVYSLNQSVLHGTRIFTPTLGWCSYCYGFLESPGVVEYVGTDVITSVCKKTAQFANEYYPNKSVKIYNSPSESLLTPKFIDQYRNHFDVVFFSPPYYRLEMYPGTNQSTTKYKTYEEWLAGYWEKTIQLCHQVLSPGGKLCYILSGYGSNNEFNLLKDMNMVTMKYFKLKSQQPMFNKNVHVTEHRETGETIMIFIK
jgi:16S rRNA G966 N2-methylase RsmD